MQKKVAVVNLEQGMPGAEEAVCRMKNALTMHKRQGIKAVILIHGYGSTGTGGKIKASAIKALGESSMRGIVRAYAGGEKWASRKGELTGMCKQLEEYEKQLAGNLGVTVVILR